MGMVDGGSDMMQVLSDACARGDLKESARTHILLWLQPSFAGVEIEGVRVKDHIRSFVEKQRWRELNDAFYQMNRFGTAGVRGRLAVGTAYFNRIILGLGVEAHARYIEREYATRGRELGRNKAVILAYDSRRGSYDPDTGGPGFLVQEAASIYAAHGITVYLFDGVAPTPELSFAITELDHIRPFAGGVFTASHNPASDNGFKPYDVYGGQIVHRAVQDIADGLDDYAGVRAMSYADGVDHGLILIVGSEIDDAYIDKEIQNAIWVDSRGRFRPDKIATDLKVVFSALNGTSQRLVPCVLARRGFNVAENLFPVIDQCRPDGRFLTCPRPNPEEKEALRESVLLAQQTSADMLIATDPDGDRLGVGVRLGTTEAGRFVHDDAVTGGYYLLSGNQQLVLLTDYILGQLAERDGRLPRNSVISKTLVSTDLARTIAESHGVMTIETHVGFKYLGEKLDLYARHAYAQARREAPGQWAGRSYTDLTRRERVQVLERHGLCCLFGGEESYGSLIGDYVKDKDAVTVCAMFVEMAGFYRRQGKTLVQRLEEIWGVHGYWREETIALQYEGSSGNDSIRAIMHRFRTDAPGRIAGVAVRAVIDYLSPSGGGPRRATAPGGAVLFDDAAPADPERHTGYADVGGVSIPLFWHADYRLAGEKACLGSADMLMYVLKDGSKIILRPSGTEPKIKIYVLARGTGGEGRGSAADRRAVNSFFERAREELTGLAAEIAG